MSISPRTRPLRPALARIVAPLVGALVVALALSGWAPGPATAGQVAEPVAAPAAETVAGPVTAAPAARAVRVRLHRAVRRLPLAREVRRGYDRDRFRHWVDANRDCQDTRDEVLAAESTRPVRGCDIRTGRWRSYYDGRVVRRSSVLDIDHMVPLAEAWDSGARRWRAGVRQAFANDLGDRRSLVAVTASSNRSKSDQDPAEWLPTRERCRYVSEWTAVKLRWSLSVDRAERRALVRRAERCANTVLTVRQASVRKAPTGGGGGLDPRFRYCYQVIDAGYGPYYRGKDPEYRWYTDSDSDGVVCER